MHFAFQRGLFFILWFPFSSYSSTPKQSVGQKRLRPSPDDGAKEDDNQVKVEKEEEVEKKKAKLSQTETDDKIEQSISAVPGRASYIANDTPAML